METPQKNEKIQVYLRLRPTTTKINHIKEKNIIEVAVHKNVSQGYVNNSKEKYLFKFDKIFPTQTKQDQIFNDIAKDVVDSSLDGYNGTIFAYGQTGSGKTYTITGGAERIDDRGIIPRAIAYIFNQIKQRTLYKWKVYISYLEIYNNDGYDLLHENQGRAKNLEDLPKVKIRENANKQFLLYNLGVHHVENEEEAMLLLLLGDENRVVAETPKNDASTRSHCIFMFQIESQKIGEDTKTLSKLHVVDLSGSEKPYKTDLNGIRMEEALNINLSLHFLEQVIVSLNKKEGHIPYRNSMMTMCLRDSLGGNCKTRMIATMSSENVDVMESISTCRFAQRVALVKNSAIKNEIEDPILVIQKQKVEIEDLKSELAMMKGKDQKSILDQEDLVNCRKIVDDYLKDDDYSNQIKLKDMLMIQECFGIIKIYYKDLEKKLLNFDNKNEIVLKDNLNLDKMIDFENSNKKLNAEIEKLKEIVRRRDQEMKVLLGIIDKFKSNGDSKKNLLSRIEEEDLQLNQIKNNFLGKEMNFTSDKSMMNSVNSLNSNNNKSETMSKTNSNNNSGTNNNSINRNPIPLQLLQDINTANTYLIREVELPSDILSEQKKAYDVFRNNYIKSEYKKENLKIIGEKFELGRKIGEKVTKFREKIQILKNEIVEIRKRKIAENVDDLKDPNNPHKIKEDSLLKEFGDIKSLEKKEQTQLQQIHDEIKSIQAMIDANDKKMTKDFDYWYEIMIKKFEWESKNGKLDQFLKKDKSNNETITNSMNSSYLSNINDSKMMNNFLSNNTSNIINKNNNTNLNNTSNSISEIAERISKTKDLISLDINKR